MAESFESQHAKSTKRQWTVEEDKFLVEGLLQLLDSGWKADAGSFKPGYTKELEKYLHKKIPNCTLKANPHIESRVKHLKKQYGAIKDMLGSNASGFGWDDTNKMIIMEKEIYRQWCKSHPAAIGLYGKPFPHFDSLDIAFGKDRATGANVESPADAAFTMMKEFYQGTQEGESRVNLDGDENNFESQLPETPTYNSTQAARSMEQSQCDATTYRGGKRGAKRVKHNDDALYNLITSFNKTNEFYATNVACIQQLTSCFLHEKHTAERRNQVTYMLKEIEGLSAANIVRAAMLITNNNNRCDCFFTMDTSELRKEFVYAVLDNNGA